MPLIILGLLVTIGIVSYAFVRYGQSEEEDTRTVRERYPHVFKKIDDMRKGASYTIIDDEDDEGNETESDSSETESKGHTMRFPDDAEVEKRKRNIH